MSAKLLLVFIISVTILETKGQYIEFLKVPAQIGDNKVLDDPSISTKENPIEPNNESNNENNVKIVSDEMVQIEEAPMVINNENIDQSSAEPVRVISDRKRRQFGFNVGFGAGHYAPDHHHHHGGYGHEGYGHGGYGHGNYGHGGGYGHGGYGHGNYEHGGYGHGGYGHGGYGHGGYGHGGYGHGGYGHGHGGYEHNHHHHHGFGRGFAQEYAPIFPTYYYPSGPVFGFEPQPPIPFNGAPTSPVIVSPPEPIPPLAPQQDIMSQHNIVVPPTFPLEIKPIIPDMIKVEMMRKKGQTNKDNAVDDQECVCKNKKKVEEMNNVEMENAEDKQEMMSLRRL